MNIGATKTYQKHSYFGARYYMSDVSVWLSVDPLADDAPGWTPYRYCFNNPIMLADPDGNFEGSPDNYVTDEATGKTTKEETDDETNTYTLKRTDGTSVDLGTYKKTNNGMVVLASSTVFYSYELAKQYLNKLPSDAASGFLSASYLFYQSTGRRVKINQFMSSKWKHSGKLTTKACFDVQYIGNKGVKGQPNTASYNVNLKLSAALVMAFNKYGFSGLGNWNAITENAWSTGKAFSSTAFLNNHQNHIHVQGFNKSFITIKKDKPCSFQY